MLGVMPADSKANFYSPHSVHFQDRINNTEHFPATIPGMGLCVLIVAILKTSFNAGISREAFVRRHLCHYNNKLYRIKLRNRQVLQAET